MKSSIYVGIDIAKHSLQICCKELSLEQSLAYEAQELSPLIKQLKKRRSKVHVICEATGGLEALLVQSLGAAKIKFSEVTPIRRTQNLGVKKDQRWKRKYGLAGCPENSTKHLDVKRWTWCSMVARRSARWLGKWG